MRVDELARDLERRVRDADLARVRARVEVRARVRFRSKLGLGS